MLQASDRLRFPRRRTAVVPGGGTLVVELGFDLRNQVDGWDGFIVSASGYHAKSAEGKPESTAAGGQLPLVGTRRTFGAGGPWGTFYPAWPVIAGIPGGRGEYLAGWYGIWTVFCGDRQKPVFLHSTMPVNGDTSNY